ncbi:hypothetical protein [Persicimonas caeni]|uniref:hypothetical protein n=1 Tax=Persicimonas caeni TaxID=2292766 RepID=UPI00164E2710|nr:hypothetical protein [Persicimonas caeni]
MPEHIQLTREDGDTDAARLALDSTGCPHVAYFQKADDHDTSPSSTRAGTAGSGSST